MNRYTQTRTADVGIGALDDILAHALPERMEAGTVLIRQGDEGGDAYYLTEGEVAVFAESSYGRVQLATVAAPRLIGELSVLANYPRTATIEALTPVSLCRLSGQQLIEVGHHAPDFLLSVISQLGRQLDGMNRALNLYGNALMALERLQFDPKILDELTNPSPQLVTFANTFKRFAEQIIDRRQQVADLASAALIQRSFLPRRELLKPVAGALDLSARMRPARDVGGDFYDYFLLDEHRLAVAIGDVCGKGIPASLFMAVVITTLRGAAQVEPNVAATLARLNEQLCRDNDASMFATAFYGVLDLRDGTLEYGNCGHNPPYILSPSGRQSLEATGIPLGLVESRPPDVARLVLKPGETLVLFTDGVTEAINPQFEQFGNTRLETLIDGAGDVSPAALLELIYEAVDEFAGGEEQADDITAVTLRLTPEAVVQPRPLPEAAAAA